MSLFGSGQENLVRVSGSTKKVGGHALVKSFGEKEDKLPLWALRNETQIIKADSLGQVS